jgi:hypothetical protein
MQCVSFHSVTDTCTMFDCISISWEYAVWTTNLTYAYPQAAGFEPLCWRSSMDSCARAYLQSSHLAVPATPSPYIHCAKHCNSFPCCFRGSAIQTKQVERATQWANAHSAQMLGTTRSTAKNSTPPDIKLKYTTNKILCDRFPPPHT